MALRLLGHIDLPEYRGAGGFDHADVHASSDRLYVAHTSNDALDVIDIARDQYIESVPGLTAAAGVLVSEARGLVFTSNRGENTVSVFEPHAERDAFKISVGVKPNGLAFDPVRGTLIAANIGDASIPYSHSVSVVDRTPGANRRSQSSRSYALGDLRRGARDVLRQYCIPGADRRDRCSRSHQDLEGVRGSGGGTAWTGTRSGHGSVVMRLRCRRTVRN